MESNTTVLVPWYRSDMPRLGNRQTPPYDSGPVWIATPLTEPDSGLVSIKIDDEKPIRKCLFTVYNGLNAYIGVPLEELDDGEHTVIWTFLDEVPDKRKILASHWRKNSDQDFIDNPQKYKDNRFSVGQIILIGELK